MNGSITYYQYYGFNEAFRKLFIEAKKPNNFTYENCKLIAKYWDLTEQIRVDYDQSDYKNLDVINGEVNEEKVEGFHRDCYEIMNINDDKIEEFTVFLHPDEIAESERKFSITDILKIKPSPPQSIKKKKEQTQPKKFKELFYDKDLCKPCIDILRKADPPLIDAECNYIGRSKGAFCVWIEEIQRQGIIQRYPDRKIYANLLPTIINGFSINESMFGKIQKRAEEIYKKDFKIMISEIKLSQNSQKAKLGK